MGEEDLREEKRDDLKGGKGLKIWGGGGGGKALGGKGGERISNRETRS